MKYKRENLVSSINAFFFFLRKLCPGFDCVCLFVCLICFSVSLDEGLNLLIVKFF